MHASPHPVLEAELTDQPPAAWADDTSGVGFVYDQVPVAEGETPLDALDYVSQLGDVAVHAIDALDGDEDVGLPGPEAAPGFSLCELGQDGIEARGAVVGKAQRPGPSEADAVVDTGVYQLVEDDDIAGLRRAAEEPGVGGEARVEEQASRRAVKGGNLALERLGRRRVAVEKPRAAAAAEQVRGRRQGPEAGHVGAPHVGVGLQREVAVGGEVDGAGRRERQAAKTALAFSTGEQRCEDVVETVPRGGHDNGTRVGNIKPSLPCFTGLHTRARESCKSWPRWFAFSRGSLHRSTDISPRHKIPAGPVCVHEPGTHGTQPPRCTLPRLWSWFHRLDRGR